MFKFILICLLVYLAFIVLRWAFTDNSKGRRRSGGFLDDIGDICGGDD